MFQRTISFMTKFWAYSLVVAALLLISCKKTSDIGHIVRPADDSLRVVTDSFIVKSTTIKAEHLYSETTKPVLGHYTDNIFGEFKVDFLSEFRYIRGLSFEDGATPDSLCVVMYYKTFFGDSTAVQEATVYQIDRKKLVFAEDYYSDTDLSEYCSKDIVLGKQSYVAYDKTVTPEERQADNYCNTVKVRLPNEMAQEMMTKTEIYASQEVFTNYLKGVYVTNTFGQQTVLSIDSVNLELSYRYQSGEDDKTHEPVYTYNRAIFPSNRETSQFIRVEGTSINLDNKPDSVEYVSCPGGTFVQLEIPFERMYQGMVEANNYVTDSLNLNYMSLVFEPAVYDETDESARMTYPVVPILIRKADVEAFFTQSLYPAPGIDTELGWLDIENTGDLNYSFVNAGDDFEGIFRKASRMSEAERKSYFDSLNPYLVIPVSGATDIAGTNAVIRHQYRPYGVRVRSGSNVKSPMRIVVTYTNL